MCFCVKRLDGTVPTFKLRMYCETKGIFYLNEKYGNKTFECQKNNICIICSSKARAKSVIKILRVFETKFEKKNVMKEWKSSTYWPLKILHDKGIKKITKLLKLDQYRCFYFHEMFFYQKLKSFSFKLKNFPLNIWPPHV